MNVRIPWVEFTPTNTSNIGMAYLSFGVSKFRFLKSMPTLTWPFFFMTRTIFDNHSTYLVVRLKPTFSNLSISYVIFRNKSRLNLLSDCLCSLNFSLIDNWCLTSSPDSPKTLAFISKTISYLLMRSISRFMFSLASKPLTLILLHCPSLHQTKSLKP